MPETAAPTPGLITVLSLSPSENDHADLARAFRKSSLTLYPNCRLALKPVASAAEALAILRKRPHPIMICDEDGFPGVWREFLQACRELPAPPCVIVTSRLANDRLWSEVLNGGGFDLLSKPFDQSEAMRIIQLAWVRWRNRYGQG